MPPDRLSSRHSQPVRYKCSFPWYLLQIDYTQTIGFLPARASDKDECEETDLNG